MEEIENIETVDIEANRWIVLEFVRRWPKQVVEWSVRQRVGDSDFPVARGAVDCLSRPEDDRDEIWAKLRGDALAQAHAAHGDNERPDGKNTRKKGLLARLFGRD